jgi:hypothetical protein
MQRRTFVRATALGCLGLVAAPLLLGCHDNPNDPSLHSTIDFSTPSGALNLALATVQLQSDFYARVYGSPYVDMTLGELTAISTIYTGKAALFKAFTTIILTQQITSVLLFDFLSVDFSSRDSVLGTAQVIEEFGVRGVNGVLGLADDSGAAACLAKVASVLSRHATTVRMLADVQSGSATRFGHGVTASGLEPTLTPDAWYVAAKPYFRTTISLRGA